MKLASVAGRGLDLRLLHTLEPEVDLETWLAALAGVAVIEAQGETWRFTHDKLREEIKESLSHEEHHALHRRVAEALEAVYPDDPEQAAILSHHWTVAGEPEKVLHYAEIAGREAAAKGAAVEAITFFERALNALETRPASPERDRRELAILMEMGPQITMAHGFGALAMEDTYLRAQELALRTKRADLLFWTIWGQSVYYNQVLGLGKARELLDQLMRLAERSGDGTLILAAHHATWAADFTRGDLAAVEEHIDQGLAIYDYDLHHEIMERYSHDPGMCAYFHGSINEWLMGQPDKAHRTALTGRAMAEKMPPSGQLYLEIGTAFVAYLRGEYGNALEMGGAIERQAEKIGHKLTEAYGLLAQAAAHTGQGRVHQGLAVAHEALETSSLVRAYSWHTFFLAELLAACLAAGEVDEGLRAVLDELAEHEVTGQRVFESELRRLYGELILADGSSATAQAEKEFLLAIDIARKQSARSLELRAVMSLARLWQKQGRAGEARARLSEIYGWFTEGFDTADLVAARKLLDELR